MKKTIVRALALALACALLLAGCGGKSDSSDMKLGTGGTTGTYYAFGGVLANVLNDKVENMNITVQSTGASKANIFLIDDGEAELAIVQNDVMDYAYNGTDLFEEDGAVKSFTAVAALYAEVCQIISAEGITSIEDLKGKRVSVGDAGSGVEFNARQILESYGISFDDITVQNLGFGDSADALKDGKIDAFFCTAGAPTTAVVELSTTNKINLLEIDDAHAAKLIESYPFYTQYAIPGGSYNGVDQDVMTVAVKATLIASDKLSEDAVYHLTKGIFDNKDAITDGHAKGAELDPAYAVAGISVPFHPGAEKYFKEVGALS
ncbi:MULTISPECIES: TAXI family TRAP transporter solute-binding subunit [Anaerotruncus]|jgi:TRAP transporter TAXI family solute receptor|uniref:TAXI family TRAP transporter solute-binding subunit n=1 Tax=Anaerotruncus TaxID=244127 RepID=UPI00082CD3DB|nr:MULTISPECIES: TAXI family TRAP transporter solute-binding subunit [Anaerotruncus]RGX56761.1 C4-dicarboxylate ABC transporter substrate-binding protein [Anaerotruncus sp. AF02-27]